MSEGQIIEMETPESERVAVPASASSTTTDALRLEDVAVRLGGRAVWRDATIRIPTDEFVAVIGPNGAGKSTLLRLLLGLLPPSQGRVEVLGRSPRRGNAEVAYVPQRRSLDADLAVRGRDMVALGADGHRWGFPLPGASSRRKQALVAEALDLVEATAFADRPIGQLSGGEQQRLLLAQALVGRPRLLLLDEPLASLDIRNQSAIARLIARLASQQRITALLVAHDVNPLLPLIQRVVCVAGGQVVAGAPEEVITTTRLTALYDSPVEVLNDSQGRTFVVGLDQHASAPRRRSDE